MFLFFIDLVGMEGLINVVEVLDKLKVVCIGVVEYMDFGWVIVLLF